MALPPENNEAFLREVDDELRRDQITGWWQRWRVVLIASLVIGLSALGGWEYWQHTKVKQAEADSQLLDETLKALGEGDMVKAPANLAKLAASDVPAYRAVALMTQAAVAAQKNDIKGAVAKYAAIAADDGLGRPFRDAAIVRQTMIEYDTMQPQAIVDRLKPLAVPGNPWFGSAGEMTAIAQIKLNQPQLAGAMFAAIAKDTQVPVTIRGRARDMAGSLGIDAIDDPKAEPAPTDTTDTTDTAAVTPTAATNKKDSAE